MSGLAVYIVALTYARWNWAAMSMKLETERLMRATMPMPDDSMVDSTLDGRLREERMLRPTGRPRPRE